MSELNPVLTQRIRRLYGKQGEAWLAGLPALLEELAKRWKLTLETPFKDLTYNYTAPAIRADGPPAVLKVGIPNKEMHTEILALRAFNGRGMVQLFEADEERGALLLERLVPGRALIEEPDDATSTAIACDVMRRLPRIQIGQSEFPSVAHWGEGFERLRAHFVDGSGPFPEELVSRAESLFGVLDTTSDTPVLLHGDLHHWNILSAQRADWLAIDPKGVVGEPAYEVGAWLRNPISYLRKISQPEKVLTRRVDQLAAELGFDRERILGWAFAQAVLSAWWSYEDNEKGWKVALEWAELLAGLS